MPDIQRNVQNLNERIAAACHAANRNPEEVRLLAVGKTRSIEAIETAAAIGLVDFGENYLQEAESKIDAMPHLSWHFIGAIQSNKTGLIANRFDWVHTIASLKVAQRLSRQRSQQLGKLQVLIQVNISGESSKSGIPQDEVPAMFEHIAGLPGVHARGLMTIPAPTADARIQRANFANLRELKENIVARYTPEGFDQLSMGMTDDFEAAIMEGSTWIRIGTAIFGPRPGSPITATQIGS